MKSHITYKNKERKPIPAYLTAIGGFFVGVINGLLGAGGGLLAVPLLKLSGFDQKNAHAGSVSIILPLSILSAVLYLIGGKVDFIDSLIYIPFGVIGAILGAVFLKKISNRWLKIIFGIIMIWSGVRLLMPS